MKRKIKKLQKRFDKAYFNILEDPEKEQIFIVNENQINEQQGIFVKNILEKSKARNFSHFGKSRKRFSSLQDASIYLAIRF
ncbi:MAG: hypothetical protein IPN09_14875 [Bacteroidetes bacterium]|nr:hypothetical protein [Bacteroidota bacterium]